MVEQRRLRQRRGDGFLRHGRKLAALRPDPSRHALVAPLAHYPSCARDEEFPAATDGGCVLDSGDAAEDNGGDGVSTAVVRGEAAVADGVPAVAVGESNGVPAVAGGVEVIANDTTCLLYTSPSPRDRQKSRMPSSA